MSWILGCIRHSYEMIKHLTEILYFHYKKKSWMSSRRVPFHVAEKAQHPELKLGPSLLWKILPISPNTFPVKSANYAQKEQFIYTSSQICILLSPIVKTQGRKNTLEIVELCLLRAKNNDITWSLSVNGVCPVAMELYTYTFPFSSQKKKWNFLITEDFYSLLAWK